MAVLCGGAAGSTVTGCKCGVSTALAATGASATAGASAVVRCSVAADTDACAAAAVAAAGVASVTRGAVCAWADSAVADEATSATGADLAAAATRGGSKDSGSTYPCGSLVTRAPKYTYGSASSTTPLGPTLPTTDASPTSVPRVTPIDPRWTSVAV
ncbi:MAG: hypothetical protein M3R37_09490 [Actinomycetota bacterium]|nr:hypothetical protein [Actinomycetota bacterium]